MLMKLQKSKLGQMKIQQMAFMLIAVTLFFALVGMFVLVVLFSNLKDSANLLEEKNALLLVSRLANSPEFSCGSAFGSDKTSCVDFDKVIALKKDIKKYSDSNFWGISGIEIVKIYPDNGNTLCTDENYPNCGKLEILKPDSGTGVSNFVALCRKERKAIETYDEQGNLIDSFSRIVDICEVAKIIVTYKDKG